MEENAGNAALLHFICMDSRFSGTSRARGKRRVAQEQPCPEELATLSISSRVELCLPPDLSRLAQLTELTICDSWFVDDQFPTPIFQLTALRSLCLARVGTIAPTMLDTLDVFAGLHHLCLVGIGLQRVPDSLMRCTALETLDLQSNALEVLPSTVGDLTGLRMLNLNNNALRELPAALTRCTSLRNLYLNGNRLEALPPEVSALPRLAFLYVGDNAMPPGAHLNLVSAAPKARAGVNKK